MKKVIIIGSKGMAGHVILRYLRDNTEFEVIDIARNSEFFRPSYEVDVVNFDRLRDIFIFEKPDIVINCIGILNRNAENNPDIAILINSYLPHFLAKCGIENNFRLIHVSTDCVFSGKEGCYSEDSHKDGSGFYAESKALGEVSYGNNLTIRTSIVGPELKLDGIGLFHWLMTQSGSVDGYTRAFWTGVTTLELAKAIVSAINNNLLGLYHLVNGEKISKFDLITLFARIFIRTDLKIVPYDGYTVDKSLLNTRTDFDYMVPSYRNMIEELKSWMLEYPDFYRQYFS